MTERRKAVSTDLVRMLPSYVGSKRYWLSRIGHLLEGEPVVEAFAGSAVLSFNRASHALWCDLDEKLCLVLSRFDELRATEPMTPELFNEWKHRPDWWRYTYQFQKVVYSGVFRYSKNGYNVPLKDKNFGSVDVSAEYGRALERWQALNPSVVYGSYETLTPRNIVLWAKHYADKSMSHEVIVVLDPPYEGSKASYNATFDYEKYWDYVRLLAQSNFRLMIFDHVSNLEKHGYFVFEGRRMRVNGGKDGNWEGLSLVNFPDDVEILG